MFTFADAFFFFKQKKITPSLLKMQPEMWGSFYNPNRIFISAKAQTSLLCLKQYHTIKDRQLIPLSGIGREGSTKVGSLFYKDNS